MSYDLFSAAADSAVVQADSEVVDDAAEFFAPAPTDLFDSLLSQHRAQRHKIAQVAGFMASGPAVEVLHWFLSGNATEDRGRISLERSADQLFNEAGAVKALDAAYWSKALALTDVLDAMPQKRRSEWHEQIRSHACPAFEEATVRATLLDLLNMRSQFFAERVDGIFRGLSGEHVTNAPEAFGKRMILLRAMSEYGTIEHHAAGLINDLRCVVAKFMGRDEPSHAATSPVLHSLKGRFGEWMQLDGGALKVRLYKKGTAHVEVHPDMAWRLNQILASMHPHAIPAQFRQRPKRRAADTVPIARPLPFRVVEALASIEPYKRRTPGDWRGDRYTAVPNALSFGYRVTMSADSKREAEGVLAAIGGVPLKDGHLTYWQFDYPPGDVVADIVASGCLPDQRAHQFYPTPASVGRLCVELADIDAGHTVLEPSAGMGDLAALLPQERTTCVELSPLHCAILKAKGYETVEADFIAWADKQVGAPFDRVVMNPPFAGGRAAQHVERAAALLKPGGRLVAVLPAGLRGKDLLPGYSLAWSRQLDNEFAGTSVSVVVLTADRPS
jgi:hypothetical protein